MRAVPPRLIVIFATIAACEQLASPAPSLSAPMPIEPATWLTMDGRTKKVIPKMTNKRAKRDLVQTAEVQFVIPAGKIIMAGWLADWKADYENADSDETTDADSDEEARATETHYHYYAPVHAETHHHYYPAFAPYTPAFAPAYGPALAPLDQLPASPPHQPVGNYDYPDYLRYRSNSSDSSSDEDQEEKPKTSAQQKEPAKKSDRARGRTQ